MTEKPIGRGWVERTYELEDISLFNGMQVYALSELIQGRFAKGTEEIFDFKPCQNRPFGEPWFKFYEHALGGFSISYFKGEGTKPPKPEKPREPIYVERLDAIVPARWA